MTNRLLFLSIMILIIGFSVTAGASTFVDNKKVLLTFDDGPHPLYTPEVLSILDEYNTNAIFFVVGKEAKKYPDILLKISNEGHLLGNHTYSHKTIKPLKDKDFYSEILRTDNYIETITKQRPKYFRPPRGKYNQNDANKLNKLGKTVLMWDYGLEKKKISEAEELVDLLITRIGWKREVLLLLHDGAPSNLHARNLTIEALPILIKKLNAKGYQFVDPTTPEGQEFIEKYAEEHPKIDIY